jgi:hypothetical protein
MEDYPIIQGQTMLVFLFAFLLTAVSSYLWTSWIIRTQRANAAELQPLSTVFRRLRQMRALVKGDFPRFLHQRWWKTLKSSVLDEWLAPMIPCLAVVITCLAVAEVLLAGK